LGKGDGHIIKVTDTEGSNELIFFLSGGFLKPQFTLRATRCPALMTL
jgi:hypothetical protein